MSVKAVANPAPLDPAIAGVTFPVGFIEFQVTAMPSPPTGVTLSLLLQNPVTLNQYWRYGPEAAMPADHFYRFDPAGGSPATGATMVGSTQVNLTFVDGAKGDDDLIVNGLLVDQGGPGQGGGLPVQLARFDAHRVGRSVALAWETVSEIKNAGFRLWREDADGTLSPVGPALIPASGSELGGARYRFTDWTAPRVAAKYWLDDISTTGTATRHGPVSVRALGGRPSELPAPPGLGPAPEMIPDDLTHMEVVQ